MAQKLRIGVDLGGTKIAVAGLTGGSEVVFEERIATPKHDYDGVVAAIRELVFRTERETGLSGTVGVGIPGSLCPKTGVVQNANSTWLNGRQFQEDLQRALKRDVRIANDANCFCLSEATDGAASDAETVFGVILGTGCGGGFVFDGRLLEGKHRIGGEWGHNPLPWPKDDELEPPQCWCGRKGCMELYVSGSGLERDHYQHTGQKLSALQIAGSKDDACLASLSRHADRLARGLAHVTNILDPDVIVLGGGLSQLSGLYDELPHLMEPYVFVRHFQPDIRPPRFGDASGVRGAARLWP